MSVQTVRRLEHQDGPLDGATLGTLRSLAAALAALGAECVVLDGRSGVLMRDIPT